MEIGHVQYFQTFAAGLLWNRKGNRLRLGKPPCDIQRQGVRVGAKSKELGTEELESNVDLKLWITFTAKHSLVRHIPRHQQTT